ncbi:GNAT family N-acetyltransferase [Actinomadura namibiensis]|uniref:RimJ/RimL family protein N-acetyltransferase n=2 Tax=Actinomadura TaxID=1988 RepID=A0A7W3QPZ1_ACTNM|nr:GNAT family N-acetyltransferase [Actinomadura namibiensis]MBA8955184.1 RimJ/RimL family protein N-acetyltransferase [Actinomadura namibiensis]
MPLLRIRTEIDDRPGRLALLTAALAARGANILGLSVQVDTQGVVDEFIVAAPPGGPGPEGLRAALEEAGGTRTAVVPARPHELVDEPTRALALVARLRAEPHALPEVLAELLRADEAGWATAAAAGDEEPDVLVVAAGQRRAVRLRRGGLPFTATEAARADALVRAALPHPSPPPGSRAVTLRDGTRVLVRPVTRGDADAVRAMHERCSLDSRRMRYFSPKPSLSRRSFELFCDPAHGLTLVAEGPDGSVLALAHLIHVLDPGVAELAFLVEDAWQGRGLGRALAGLLLGLGRERGLVELRATALGENVRMRRLLASLGGRTRRTGEPGVLEVRMRLDGRSAAPGAVDPGPGGALAG